MFKEAGKGKRRKGRKENVPLFFLPFSLSALFPFLLFLNNAAPERFHTQLTNPFTQRLMNYEPF